MIAVAVVAPEKSRRFSHLWTAVDTRFTLGNGRENEGSGGEDGKCDNAIKITGRTGSK